MKSKQTLKILFSILIGGMVVFTLGFGLGKAGLLSSTWPWPGRTTTPTARKAQQVGRPGGVIPELPFADNPDPDECGIPRAWGEDDQAWLSGYYQGEMVEPVVHLYDSHLRNEVQARAPHGREVEIKLYQKNPVLDYYLVKITGKSGPGSEGWVPAPFLSFEPVEPLK